MSAAADGGALGRFTRTSEAVAGSVIRRYSTSFGLATRMLGRRHRRHIANVYAMVRVADEIVDGVAAEAGLDAAAQAAALDRYEEETYRAMASGYSPDVILHAFASTARHAGMQRALVEPFFASMRSDLVGQQPAGDFDTAAHEAYVFGSAETVGLMCLEVFLARERVSAEQRATLEQGARSLGAAFQNVNFLRDLADDTDRLGRAYLTGAARMTPAQKQEWVDTVRSQLADADAAVPLLPRDARAAVRGASALFGALTARIERTPVEQLYRRRIRVPDAQKLALAVRAATITRMERA